MAFPKIPDGIRPILEQGGLRSLYAWLAQDFTTWMTSKLDTQGDVTLLTAGKGVILKNAAGTLTKRVRLNDTGDGWIFEDV